MPTDLLSHDEITNALASLDNWMHSGNTIRKTWQRKGFNGAMQLANVVAYVANQAGHHPDIAIHDYNQVTVTVTTHDAGGVTHHDLELAQRIERAIDA